MKSLLVCIGVTMACGYWQVPATGNRAIKQKTVKGALFSSDNSGNSRTRPIAFKMYGI